MKHPLFLAIAVLLLASVTQNYTALAQSPNPADGVLIVVWKYDGAATLMINNEFDRYEAVGYGKIWRSFPAGSKTSIVGDGRLPEGIYKLRPMDGKDTKHLGFTFETLPDTYETYYVKGKTLDRNVIPLDDDFLRLIHEYTAGLLSMENPPITLVILLGDIPVEMRDRIKMSKNLQPWMTEEALDDSVRRLKPLNDYITIVHRIPEHYRFADDGTWIIEDAMPSAEADPGIAGR